MPAWTLLQLLPASFPKYLDHIQNRYPHIEIYYPRHEVLSRPAGRRRPLPVIRPIFPGYLFARPDFANGDHRSLTHNTPTRVFFVKFGGHIEFISERTINILKTMENLGQLAPKPGPQPRLTSGQRVIVALPTVDLIGIILRIAQNKVLVDVSIGQMTVPLHQVAPFGGPGPGPS